MNKIYCPECGAPTGYGSKKPNFCINCGSPLNKAVASKRKAFLEEDSDDSVGELNIEEGFELDVEITGGLTKMTVADLAGTGQASPPEKKPKRKRGRPPKINKKKIWEQFKDEAGGTPRKENFEESS